MTDSTNSSCTKICEDTTNVTTVVTEVDPETEATTTTTTTQNTTCTQTETFDNDNDFTCCNMCGDFNLDKLAEQSRDAAFRSSNIAAATSNSILIFSMLILQELLKKECHRKTLDFDRLFLIVSAIAALGENVKIYNPQPFNV